MEGTCPIGASGGLWSYRRGALHSGGSGAEGDTSFMQCFTRYPRNAGRQAFQKSACMLRALPEESVTLPRVVGMGKVTFMVSTGTDLGWVDGHRTLPPIGLL